VYLCLLKTWDRVGQLSSNFQGSSRAPRAWFIDENSWSHGYRVRKFNLFFGGTEG